MTMHLLVHIAAEPFWQAEDSWGYEQFFFDIHAHFGIVEPIHHWPDPDAPGDLGAAPIIQIWGASCPLDAAPTVHIQAKLI